MRDGFAPGRRYALTFVLVGCVSRSAAPGSVTALEFNVDEARSAMGIRPTRPPRGARKASQLGDVTELSLGGHSCARLRERTVHCWGLNDVGQLGIGTRGERRVTKVLSGLAGAVQIAVGPSHSCARRSDGEALCWGDNTLGALGDGTSDSHRLPNLVQW